MTTLLVDGDIYVYQIASACQPAAIDFGDQIYSIPQADAREACGRFVDRMAGFMKDTGASDLVIALKGRGNFRTAIFPEYKMNRRNTIRPILLAPMMEYIHATYRTFERPMLEGDDILGILATSDKIIKGEKIIVSEDKDLLQIPGLHYQGPTEGLRPVSVEQGDYMHMLQTLTGDAVDNYKGCPGVGPKTAQKILEAAKPHEMWEAVVLAYAQAGYGILTALEQARVARILRATDYNFKTKEPILWSPPTP